MLVRPLLACALLVGAVPARGAAADDTVLMFVVGHSVGTVSVVADQVVLSTQGGEAAVGRLRALVIDARRASTGWALSVSARCGPLWPSATTVAPPDVRIWSRHVRVLVPGTETVSQPFTTRTSALVLRTAPQPFVAASAVNESVTDVDSVVTLTSAGQTGTYVCPLTQTVS